MVIIGITRSLAEIFWNNECKHKTLMSGNLAIDEIGTKKLKLLYFQMYVFEAIHRFTPKNLINFQQSLVSKCRFPAF